LNNFFWCTPFVYLYFSYFYNEPELGAEIDPGMTLTPLPSSIGQGSNPPPSDYEPSALPLDHSFCLPLNNVCEIDFKGFGKFDRMVLGHDNGGTQRTAHHFEDETRN